MRSNLNRVGKTACIRYSGGVQGEYATDSTGTETRCIELGAGKVPIGFEDALFDMTIGETRDVVIDPKQGFGKYDEKMTFSLMREALPHGRTLRIGSVLTRPNPITGDLLPARVVNATTDYVMLDQNHPWAGRTLQYRIELISIE